MNKNFEYELPEGYEPARVIDFTDKKTAIIMNAAALAITVVIIAAAWLIIKPLDALFTLEALGKTAIMLVVLLAYIVLHELAHGAAYKLLTGEKLKFGLTMGAAYCGVPHIYVYRRASLISLLTPFVLFSVVFGVPLLFAADRVDAFLLSFLLANHIGGCSGDLYDTYLLLFKHKDKLTLVHDNGPTQVFYEKR